jgi:hypothetical protein
LSGGTGDAEGAVRSLFEVKQSFVLPDGELEFQVGYEEGTKKKFTELKAKLLPMGLRPELTGNKEECVLVLRRQVVASKKLPRLPVFLVFFTLAAVVVSTLLQQEIYQALTPSLAKYDFFAFGITVAAILGAHELAQRVMAKRRDSGHASSYLIPWVSVLPPFLPSLGFYSSQREPALNRDSLFDTVFAGPLAMLGVAVLLYAVGLVTAVQSSVPLSHTNLTLVTINPNAIQVAVGTLLSPFTPSTLSGYVAISPLVDGSTIGFILVFVCLLPMAAYDGGLMASAAWGQRAARLAGYLSVLALLTLDTPTYWGVAVLALVLVGRPLKLKLQDDVSPLSPSRGWLLVAAIVVAFLCLPFPHNFATISLP